MSVNKIVKANEVNNCHDRWYVARSAAREMKGVSSEVKKNCGKTWHPELIDKTAKTRIHLYWSIDNCKGDPALFKFHLDNLITHFCNNHCQCDSSSTCREPDYVPNYDVIKNPVAIKLLIDFIHHTPIYRQPNDYIYDRDTFLVESFNNGALIYLDKQRSTKIRRPFIFGSWPHRLEPIAGKHQTITFCRCF